MKITSKKIAEFLIEKLEKAHSPEAREEIVKAFAGLIVSEGKVAKLREIEAHFSSLWSKKHKEIDVTIETPGDEPSFPKHIGDHKVNVIHKKTPELLAGARISFGDYTVDQTLRRDLTELKALL